MQCWRRRGGKGQRGRLSHSIPPRKSANSPCHSLLGSLPKWLLEPRSKRAPIVNENLWGKAQAISTGMHARPACWGSHAGKSMGFIVDCCGCIGCISSICIGCCCTLSMGCIWTDCCCGCCMACMLTGSPTPTPVCAGCPAVEALATHGSLATAIGVMEAGCAVRVGSGDGRGEGAKEHAGLSLRPILSQHKRWPTVDQRNV